MDKAHYEDFTDETFKKVYKLLVDCLESNEVDTYTAITMLIHVAKDIISANTDVKASVEDKNNAYGKVIAFLKIANVKKRPHLRIVNSNP